MENTLIMADVDGIFNKDPQKNPDATLIPEVTNENLAEVLKGITTTERADVTGGMHGKIMSIKNNLPGVLVYIVNGLKPNTLEKIIQQDPIGTKLLLD